jgi:hypothetical protein
MGESFLEARIEAAQYNRKGGGSKEARRVVLVQFAVWPISLAPDFSQVFIAQTLNSSATAGHSHRLTSGGKAGL